MLADDGAGFAAGAGAEETLLQDDDTAGLAPGQRPGDAGAHDAAADDEDVTGLGHTSRPSSFGRPGPPVRPTGQATPRSFRERLSRIAGTGGPAPPRPCRRLW